MVNVWVGTELGSLRGLDFTTNLNTVVTYGEISKSNEIVSLTPSPDGTELYCTLKKDIVNVFNVPESIYVNQYDMEGELCAGFGIGDRFITCSKCGDLAIWEDDEVLEKISLGPNIEKCVRNASGQVISGGKENELKVWDLETKKAVYTSKNIPRDFLELRVPVWIRSISPVPNSDLIAIGTHYNQYRLYDIRAKRRPIISIDWEEFPISCVSTTDRYCYVANTKGDLGKLDLRTGKLLNKYLGSTGSIRSISLHPTEPYLASVGLDRFLRVHNTETRQIMFKFYLKTRLNCVLFTGKEVVSKKDDVWDELEVMSGEVGKKRKRAE